MTAHLRRVCLWGLALTLTGPAPATAQTPAGARDDFLGAIGAFSLALEGTYGDEADRLTASLDAAEAALARWDAAVEAAERDTVVAIEGADPLRTAQLRTRLAGVYLERGRARDAVRQLEAAEAAGAAWAGPTLLRGLILGRLLQQPAEATNALRAVLAEEPMNAAAAYTVARHLMRTGADDALDHVRRFLEIASSQPPAGPPSSPPFISVDFIPEQPRVEPFLPPAIYREGFDLLQRSELKAALAELRRALLQDPLVASRPAGDADPVARAASAFRDGRVDQARALLEEAIGRSPARAEAHRVLGMVHLAEGRFEQAVAALTTSVSLNSSDERARLALAQAFQDSEQLDAAEQLLLTTLDTHPASGRARYALALTYRSLGKITEAIEALRAALMSGALLGRNTIYGMMAIRHRDRQDFEAAIEAFAARVDAIPNDPNAHYDLGEIYVRAGDTLRARAEFEVTLLLDPNNAEAHTSLGQLHLSEARYLEAAEATRRALLLNPSHREARYVHATALIRLGNTADGERQMQEFQRLQAEDAAARTRGLELGRLRREASTASANGLYRDAVALLQQALILDPRSPSSHLDLGVALIGAGQLETAVERLTTAAALDAHLDVYRHLADAYSALGQADASRNARATYERLKQERIRETGRIR